MSGHTYEYVTHFKYSYEYVDIATCVTYLFMSVLKMYKQIEIFDIMCAISRRISGQLYFTNVGKASPDDTSGDS